jgi:hypothetical protein
MDTHGTREFPGVFTRVKMFLDWIKATTMVPQEFVVNKAIIGHKIVSIFLA